MCTQSYIPDLYSIALGSVKGTVVDTSVLQWGQTKVHKLYLSICIPIPQVCKKNLTLHFFFLLPMTEQNVLRSEILGNSRQKVPSFTPGVGLVALHQDKR